MQETRFAYYPVFRLTEPFDASPPASDLAGEWETILDKHPDVEVRGVYSSAGFRPDADLFLWLIAPSADVLQETVVELRRTELGRHLELTWAFLGVHRPAEFSKEHVPAFLRGEPPRRYISVYPFVRTEEWYLLPAERRAELLRAHGEMGREYPDVLANTTNAFGLGDWEWILAFETDDLPRIVECLRHLRAAEARRYTKVETPFILGIRKELRDAIADLA